MPKRHILLLWGMWVLLSTVYAGSTLQEALDNLTYPLPLGTLANSSTITLQDGSYDHEATREHVVLREEPRVYADLNGDGFEDALVILEVNTGGSGIFHYLVAVINHQGHPKAIPALFIGDRTDIQDLSYQLFDQTISLQALIQGPDDPLCCPTHEVTWRYKLTQTPHREAHLARLPTDATFAHHVANGSYTLNDEVITLSYGTFDGEPYIEGGVSAPHAQLVSAYFTDLDADGDEDVVALLVFSGGGTGHFYHLVAIDNHEGEAKQIASHFVDDRLIFNSLTGMDSLIMLDAVVHGAEDAGCCPTHHVLNVYQVIEGAFEVLEQYTPPTISDTLAEQLHNASNDITGDKISLLNTRIYTDLNRDGVLDALVVAESVADASDRWIVSIIDQQGSAQALHALKLTHEGYLGNMVYDPHNQALTVSTHSYRKGITTKLQQTYQLTDAGFKPLQEALHAIFDHPDSD